MPSVALVTGSAKGLGREIAFALARAGYAVVVHYHTSKPEAVATLKALQEIEPACTMVQGNLTEEDDVRDIFNELGVLFGHLDVLINLVGNFSYRHFLELSFKEFRDVTETNYYSAFLCMKAALPVLRRHGRIINFACSLADQLPVTENSTQYYAAKTALLAMSKAAAVELRVRDITVNVISPGVLPTSTYLPGSISKNQMTTFKEVIDRILFLLSDEAKGITGQNFDLSHGWRPDFEETVLNKK